MGTELWQEAASFAARVHQHQTRRDGTTPYIAHPFRVAMTVRDIFGLDDPEALAAALLHDAIEDTRTDYDDLKKEFGGSVADLVAALTKNMSLPEARREPEYDRRLAEADWRARLVKLADVHDNLCDVGSLDERDREKKLRRAVAKCARAIELARPDAGAHPETARAIAAVERLMESHGGASEPAR
ncbi:MAG TPA: HD domain-containing protein [Phycisphaerales bacterium]|nr:HD domain-containing protein [Phycisphaerales bacterium]